MNSRTPRLAYFADCYHEENPLGDTSRQFASYLQQRGHPALFVHAGPDNRVWDEGSIRHCSFRRGFPQLRLGDEFTLDAAFLLRHYGFVRQAFRTFGPNLIHLTGPGDCGLLGTVLARRTNLSIVASWHADLHELAARHFPPWLPGQPELSAFVRTRSLNLLIRFYRSASRTIAPTPHLASLLHLRTGNPSILIPAGVDRTLFHPSQRIRECAAEFRVGYWSPSPEHRDPRCLLEISRTLRRDGIGGIQFCIMGQGHEPRWIHRLQHAVRFAGLPAGLALARALADMDALVFPPDPGLSATSVLQALASGVPVLISSSNGPVHLLDNGVSGFLCEDAAAFAAAIERLARNPARHAAIREESRRASLPHDWNSIFDSVCRFYSNSLLPASSLSQSLHEKMGRTA